MAVLAAKSSTGYQTQAGSLPLTSKHLLTVTLIHIRSAIMLNSKLLLQVSSLPDVHLLPPVKILRVEPEAKDGSSLFRVGDNGK